MFELNDRKLPRISESLFKDKYLKLLYSKPTGLNYYDEWYKVSLTPFIAVDVYSDDKTRLLFTVPPLRYSTVTRTDFDYVKYVKEIEFVQTRSVMKADKMITQGIKSTLVKAPIPVEDRKAWYDIGVRYGIFKDTSTPTVDTKVEYDDEWN